MEQITKVREAIYYGVRLCHDVDEAYRLFREDFHNSLGKAYYRRLNIPARIERIHGHKTWMTDSRYEEADRRFSGTGRVPCYILGIIDISYVYTIGLWDIPDIDEQRFDDYMDWLFSRTGALRMMGNGNGRRNKHFK